MGIEIPNIRRDETNPKENDAQPGILIRLRKWLIPKVYLVEQK
jgi:hypothetical protein